MYAKYVYILGKLSHVPPAHCVTGLFSHAGPIMETSSVMPLLYCRPASESLKFCQENDDDEKEDGGRSSPNGDAFDMGVFPPDS